MHEQDSPKSLGVKDFRLDLPPVDPSFRDLDPGMGRAVAERTVFRMHADGTRENWGEVADRVSFGNVGLIRPKPENWKSLGLEMRQLNEHLRNGRILMSGRHLQHGDAAQFTRNQEVFTNCSTAATTAMLFYLLLNGSGVGRAYHDEMMLVDWHNMPTILPVLGRTPEGYTDKFLTPGEPHPDATYCSIDLEAAQEIVCRTGLPVTYFPVPDSREGWAKAVERLEALTYHGGFRDSILVLDFSCVRPKGAPIAGMQGRPSSGPIPMIEALSEASALRSASGMEPWEQTMRIDHYLASCVAVGGARRAARMSVKHYQDPGVFDFIRIKKSGGLWSSNNSVGVDAAFWERVDEPGSHEQQVFQAVLEAQYFDASGEPGLINLDRLHVDRTGLAGYSDGAFAGSRRYQLDEQTKPLMQALGTVVAESKYPMIVNPCGEIPLAMHGGYCTIGSAVPFFADTQEQAIDAFKAVARALIRVNTMDSLYQREVQRTNRIGVGYCGIFEFAWKEFGFGFRDLIAEADLLLDPDPAVNQQARSYSFWNFLDRAREATEAEADRYSTELGMGLPHTVTMLAPAGTIAKLYALSEGGHLPALGRYLRWVQFQKEDPLLDQYEGQGYPVLRVVPGGQQGQGYDRVSLVGFPTEPLICRLGMKDKLVTASEATPEEQYLWVMLNEKYWLGPRGNQLSYTLKFDSRHVSFDEWTGLVRKYQPQVRCLSVMPADAWEVTKQKYGYVPEEPVTDEAFRAIVEQIANQGQEQIGDEHLLCGTGGCPL